MLLEIRKQEWESAIRELDGEDQNPQGGVGGGGRGVC